MTIRLKYLSLLQLAFLALPLYSFAWGNVSRVKGFYISFSNDTNFVNLNIPISHFGIFDFSNRIEYLDSNNYKHLLVPELVKEVDFVYHLKAIKLVSKPYNGKYFDFITDRGKTGHTSFFFQVINDSAYLKLYYFSSYKVGSYVLQKGADSLYFESLGIHTRNKLKHYVADCPKVFQKLSDTHFYWYKTSLELLLDYNRFCTSLSGAIQIQNDSKSTPPLKK